MDDRAVGTEEEEQHVNALDEVLTRIKMKGMKLKLSKCSFGKRKLEVLGHQITPDGLLPSQKHIEGIKNLRCPTSGAELLRFIGFINYFAQFIEHFSHRMRPLQKVLEGSGFNKKKKYKSQKVHIKNCNEKWGSAQIDACTDLKQELMQPTVLPPWKQDEMKRVMTDASDYGLGAVLLQQENSGDWRPMAYAAKKMSEAEQKYTITERYCLAVVFALRKWRHYLYGLQKFEVITAHSA